MIPVVWLSLNPTTPGRGYWDQGMLESLFSHELWDAPHLPEFTHTESLEGITDGAIIVFPARAQVHYIDQLNELIKPLNWVILMLTGDEEAVFPFEKLSHPNMKLWVMSPRRQERYNNVRFLGTGYPPQAREYLTQIDMPERDNDWYFAGQVTHERRMQLGQQLELLLEQDEVEGYYLPTPGFTQGLDPVDYYREMARAKIAYAPSGPETPDSFRLFEALEAGCVPMADTRVQSSKNNDDFGDDYWQFFFGEIVPFPVIRNYSDLIPYTMDALDQWKKLSNRIFAWWMKMKRKMAHDLVDDIRDVRGLDPCKDQRRTVTVLMPSSVIPAHPSTEMLEKCIADIRLHLPESEIILMLDGVREEQANRVADYEEYVRRVLWMAHHKWHNVLPVVFEEHMHQAKMTRVCLDLVKTDTILFVEHDAPLCPDFTLPWDDMITTIRMGEAYTIRFHHEALVLPDHDHMMFDKETQIVNNVPMRRTMQWSQRPHLSNTFYYKHMLKTYFNPESKTMIEDVMHGRVHSVCEDNGLDGWYIHRLWMYTPEGNIKRSYHLDGRGEDPKYDMDIRPVENG